MSNEPDIMVTHRDIAACKFCFNGARYWCSQHGIAWQEFLSGGVSSERLLALGDGLANMAVEAARKRVARQQ